MEMYLWDKYEKDKIPSAAIYWADYWKEKPKSFGHIEYGILLENPKTLVKLLQDEIDFNGLQSKEVKSYLVGRVKYYLTNKFLLDEVTRGYFELLKESLQSATVDFIYSTATQCESHLSSGQYVKYLIEQLKSEIIGNGELTKVRLLSDCLIIEFMSAGYNVDYIRSVPKKILSFLHRPISEMLYSDFPHKAKLTSYQREDGSYDFESYNNTLKTEIDGLSLEDRILAIADLYFCEEEILTFIFPLRGARGDEGSVHLGDVHIYSPKEFNYLTKEKGVIKSDVFKDYNDLPMTQANVAIKLKARDTESAREEALSKIREALNLLQFYLPGNIELSVESTSCHVVSENGQLRHTSAKA